MLASNRTIAHRASLLMLLGALAGCTQLDLQEDFAWPGWEPKPQVPDHMTDVWTYTVLRQPGQPGVRGFGGRIMFFTKEQKTPVKVDGTLTVFAFDAAGDDPTRAVPLKKFAFKHERLEEHYSKSKLGHSYSFWLPWDEAGGPQLDLSLITRFEAGTGEVVVSEPSRHRLPGTAVASQAGPDGRGVAGPNMARSCPPFSRGYVEQVSHEVPVDPTAQTAKMTTTTINLTPSFTDQIRAAGNRRLPAVADQRQAGTSTAWPDAAPPRALGYVQNPCELLPRPGRAEEEGGPVIGTRTPEGPTAAANVAAGWPSQSPGAVARESSPAARFAPPRFPARTAATTGPRYDPVRRQPHHATWPSRLPPTPRSGWSGEARATTPAVGPATNYALPPAAY